MFEAFLRKARPSWKNKDIAAAQEKLLKVDIDNVPQLFVALKGKGEAHLNRRLMAVGEKGFGAETLQVLREFAENPPAAVTLVQSKEKQASATAKSTGRAQQKLSTASGDQAVGVGQCQNDAVLAKSAPTPQLETNHEKVKLNERGGCSNIQACLLKEKSDVKPMKQIAVHNDDQWERDSFENSNGGTNGIVKEQSIWNRLEREMALCGSMLEDVVGERPCQGASGPEATLQMEAGNMPKLVAACEACETYEHSLPFIKEPHAQVERFLTNNEPLFWKSTPVKQKEFFQSLTCKVYCDEQSQYDVEPDANAIRHDLCRIDGPVNKKELADTISMGGTPKPTDVARYFNAELRQRVCFLDGDGLERRAEKDSAMLPKGGVAALALMNADLVVDAHKEYLNAGSDICSTYTLGSEALALACSETKATPYELNKAAAETAKKATAAVTMQEPGKPRFVAGAIGGPTSSSSSWQALVDTYIEEVRGLVDGGVDLLAIEICDTVSGKAAIYAVDEFFERAQKQRLPFIISAAVTESDGRTASGQTIEGLCISIQHAMPMTIGIHCGPGVGTLDRFCKLLAASSPSWCHACPADEDPKEFAIGVFNCAKDGLLNFVGGRGALPTHISAAAAKLNGVLPQRQLATLQGCPRCLCLSGLEPLVARPNEGVRFIGQRCNVRGCERFRESVEANDLGEAVNVAVEQSDNCADVLDVSFESDSSGRHAMREFLRKCSTERRVWKLPLMLSFQQWEANEEALKMVPGKSLVNAISLENGEAEFLRMVKACQRYGAAAVVLAIDEKCTSRVKEKVLICQRSYRLLRQKLDFAPEDIVFDLQVPTLDDDHPHFVLQYLNALAEVKRTCPGVSIIGGVSDLSKSHRGLPRLREALHSIFLYHAVQHGMNLAFVNPGSLPRYVDIQRDVRKVCEDVVLNNLSEDDHMKSFRILVSVLGGTPLPGETPWKRPPMSNVIYRYGARRLQQNVKNSSISVLLGQSGMGAATGASAILDSISLWSRAQGLNQCCSMPWGPVGDIGMRGKIYGSRDVFDLYDLGQRLITMDEVVIVFRSILGGAGRLGHTPLPVQMPPAGSQ